ncbi:hypothetical protein B0H17DRAFT_1213940 [Mycena rosella]|uniref:Uncharacterized protein n=1 Tax=Mycena rosella TaxID=1033263 RepID=A0AAD7CP60_MYCRO|nr:hypothetical protein B0H17DRAFT_1213940 [Mycena rosella]
MWWHPLRLRTLLSREARSAVQRSSLRINYPHAISPCADGHVSSTWRELIHWLLRWSTPRFECLTVSLAIPSAYHPVEARHGIVGAACGALPEPAQSHHTPAPARQGDTLASAPVDLELATVAHPACLRSARDRGGTRTHTGISCVASHPVPRSSGFVPWRTWAVAGAMRFPRRILVPGPQELDSGAPRQGVYARPSDAVAKLGAVRQARDVRSAGASGGRGGDNDGPHDFVCCVTVCVPAPHNPSARFDIPARVYSAAIRHPPSAIRHLPPATRHPPSALRTPPLPPPSATPPAALHRPPAHMQSASCE